MCPRVIQLVLLATVIVLAAALLSRQSREASHAALVPAEDRSAPAVLLTSAEGGGDVEPDSLLGSLDLLALDSGALPTAEYAAFAQAADDQPQDASEDQDKDVAPPQPAGDRPHGRGGPGGDDRRPGMPPRDGLRGDGERDRERGRERGGPWTQHGPRMLMNPEMIARCLEVANEVDKELGARLAESRQKNPEEFDRSMRVGGFGRRLLALAELKQRDPDLYRAKLGELSQAVEIERTAKKLREARRNASQGDIDLYETELRRLLQNQLAMSIKARTELLCRLDERIAELRGEIERDAQNFQGIIDARLKVLANEPARPATPAAAAPPATPAQ
jgi:hypothetical protein